MNSPTPQLLTLDFSAKPNDSPLSAQSSGSVTHDNQFNSVLTTQIQSNTVKQPDKPVESPKPADPKPAPQSPQSASTSSPAPATTQDDKLATVGKKTELPPNAPLPFSSVSLDDRVQKRIEIQEKRKSTPLILTESQARLIQSIEMPTPKNTPSIASISAQSTGAVPSTTQSILISQTPVSVKSLNPAQSKDQSPVENSMAKKSEKRSENLHEKPALAISPTGPTSPPVEGLKSAPVTSDLLSKSTSGSDPLPKKVIRYIRDGKPVQFALPNRELRENPPPLSKFESVLSQTTQTPIVTNRISDHIKPHSMASEKQELSNPAPSPATPQLTAIAWATPGQTSKSNTLPDRTTDKDRLSPLNSVLADPTTPHRVHFFPLQGSEISHQSQPKASSPVTAPLPPQTRELVASQFLDSAKAQLSGENQTISIQLKPDHLGEIRMELKIEPKGPHDSAPTLTAKIQVESDSVKSVIQERLGELKTTLEDQNGISIKKFEITSQPDLSSQAQNHPPMNQGRQFKIRMIPDSPPENPDSIAAIRYGSESVGSINSWLA